MFAYGTIIANSPVIHKDGLGWAGGPAIDTPILLGYYEIKTCGAGASVTLDPNSELRSGISRLPLAVSLFPLRAGAGAGPFRSCFFF